MTVDRTESGVTVLDRVDHDTNRHQVEDLVEVTPLADHLLVEAPEVLATSGQLRLDRQIVQPRIDLTKSLGEIDVSLRGTCRHQVVDLGVTLRIQRGKREVLQLLLHLLHAETMSEGRIDVEGLLGGATLLVDAR